MKKVLLFICLLQAPAAFSQCMDEPAPAEDTLSQLLNLFLNMDLVIGPEIYNPKGDTGLQYVIFVQDTLFGMYEGSSLVNAAINREESKTALYCIGSVGNYRIDDWIIGIIIRKGYSDGREVETFHAMHFNDIPISFDLDYEYATYGIDVELYWAYGDGVID